MVLSMKHFCLLLLMIFFSTASFAASPETTTLDFQQVTIQSALRIIADRLKMNIVISPTVHGNTSLHLEEVTTTAALDHLLATHGLKMWRIKNVSYVATMAEYMQYKENEVKQKLLENEASMLETVVWQIRYAKASDIAQLIENSKHSLLSKRGYLSVDTRTNMICVSDVRSTIETIHKFIRRIDVPVKQVLIETKLASIDSDYEQELGFHFSASAPETKGDAHYSRAHTSSYNLAVLSLPDGSVLHWQLSALERSGHGELISSPSLFTANQQTAVIESGEEIPYQESTSSGATAVTFKKAVLSLKVTPQIMPEDNVLLELKVNQDKPSKRTVLGVPSINTRQMTTSVLIKSGQTIVLGGIYESNQELDEERVPYLATLPGLGWLFKEQNKIHHKRELLIFVTPKIIH